MGTSVRLLVLEDDPADARLVEHMLRRLRQQRFEVTVVDRLSRALTRIGERPCPIDAILADLSVPDSTGIATLSALMAAAPQLPVVVLTGNDDDALALEALKRGAQDYVVKGRSDGALLSRVIRYAIERKSAEQALMEARNKAEAAARAKTIFLAMMGHEMRTPLNGILGMARLLAETKLDSRQRVFAETVLSSGELLLGLVNDILDFSRLDAERLVLDAASFDVVDTVEEVRLALAPRAAEKGLSLLFRLAPGIGPTVFGDRLRLRQILFNLVGNAVKFTDQGRVTIAVAAIQAAGAPQRLRFTVSDTGIGIAEEARPHLFSEFWQGESGADRRYAGTGLGLAICRRLAALMGGEISYESECNRGTTFRVDLPLPVTEMPVLDRPERAVSPPRRVLLVDDNEVNLEVAGGLLERGGHKVVSVADGYQAVEAARQGGFDLVLLDMRMPGMDGFQTAKAIRSLPEPAGAVPIYLLTANLHAADEGRWREAGMEGCLAKPFRVDDLDHLLAGLGDRRASSASSLSSSLPPGGGALVQFADLAEDVQALGGERMLGLVDLFRRSSSADLSAILGHARDGRLEELGQVVHRMTGAAVSLHLTPLAECCRRLESLALKEDAAAIGLASDLAALWERSVAALATALDRLEG
jgi:signal transduction histidine kinase/HPt (histidine-containing phosphotransfer) domain-containing protein